MQRVINIWEIRKPYNQNIILQIVLNIEEEYVQAGLFQTFYFPLKLKKKKKPMKTTDMSMVEWVGGSSCEMNDTFHSVLWKSYFKHAYNYYLLQWHTSLPCSTVLQGFASFLRVRISFGDTNCNAAPFLTMHMWAGRADKEILV